MWLMDITIKKSDYPGTFSSDVYMDEVTVKFYSVLATVAMYECQACFACVRMVSMEKHVAAVHRDL